ncbi:hypothetical protein IKG64_03230 [Candidatus Saccharibacteria bacterium]|nr:hypothetical protein [Candidatus Saccharibacteria bacterium]
MNEQLFDEKKLKRDLKIDARGVGIPVGAAEDFVERVVKDAQKSFGHRQIITEADLKRAVVKELKKYNADFAYVYQNRDKII